MTLLTHFICWKINFDVSIFPICKWFDGATFGRYHTWNLIRITLQFFSTQVKRLALTPSRCGVFFAMNGPLLDFTK